MNQRRLSLFFKMEKHAHNLNVFTFLLFLFSAFERALSTATSTYKYGELHFSFVLKEIDIIYISIYFSVALLVAFKVKYTYILIPDFVLLMLKIYTIVINTNSVINYKAFDIITNFSAIENITESLLFSIFLIVLFVGKLTHFNNGFLKYYPILCMRLLIFCFPATVIFEVIKIILATEMHQYPFVIFFNFTKNVLNEAFLDLPYFLLVMLMAFVPQEKR